MQQLSNEEDRINKLFQSAFPDIKSAEVVEHPDSFGRRVLIVFRDGEEFSGVVDERHSVEDVIETIKSQRPEPKKSHVPSRIENTFKYHAPKGDQQERYERIREKGKELALLIEQLCPVSQEREWAMYHLETSNMWANASIARNE